MRNFSLNPFQTAHLHHKNLPQAVLKIWRKINYLVREVAEYFPIHSKGKHWIFFNFTFSSSFIFPYIIWFFGQFKCHPMDDTNNIDLTVWVSEWVSGWINEVKENWVKYMLKTENTIKTNCILVLKTWAFMSLKLCHFFRLLTCNPSSLSIWVSKDSWHMHTHEHHSVHGFMLPSTKKFLSFSLSLPFLLLGWLPVQFHLCALDLLLPSGNGKSHSLHLLCLSSAIGSSSYICLFFQYFFFIPSCLLFLLLTWKHLSILSLCYIHPMPSLVLFEPFFPS